MLSGIPRTQAGITKERWVVEGLIPFLPLVLPCLEALVGPTQSRSKESRHQLKAAQAVREAGRLAGSWDTPTAASFSVQTQGPRNPTNDPLVHVSPVSSSVLLLVQLLSCFLSVSLVFSLEVLGCLKHPECLVRATKET